jgi:hypothetical protein
MPSWRVALLDPSYYIKLNTGFLFLGLSFVTHGFIVHASGGKMPSKYSFVTGRKGDTL